MNISSCCSKSDSLTNNKQLPQSLITSIYQTQLCNNPAYLTLTWCKTPLSHSLTIHSLDSFSITIPLQPSNTFPFFFQTSRCGSKSISLSHRHQELKLHWDFTNAKFTSNSAEPKSCFYVAISYNACIEFFLGDHQDVALRRSNSILINSSTLLSRREHVFGHKSYGTSAVFLDVCHDIAIECVGGALRVKIDGEVQLVVKRLEWKFRGNEGIMIGETEIDFYWDVFDWVAGSGNGVAQHGVFVFQVGDGGVLPELVGLEKRLLMRKSTLLSPAMSLSSSSSCSSVMQWAEESSDGGRSSCASSSKSSGSGGFSLILYAWRSD